MDLSSPIRAPSRETPHTRLLPLLAILVAPLAACESEIAAPGEEVFEEGELSFDASSPTDFVYLNLAGGTRVSPSDPAASTEWHMAFRRFSVRLNSGVSGPGSVSGYNLGNNASSSADQIIALTPEDGEAAFQAFTEADIPGSSAFVEDGLAPDPGSSWFRFDPQAGTLVADPRVAWKVRESSGRGHALFRVVELRMEGQRPLGLNIEYRRQDPGGTLGEPGIAGVDLTRGPAYVGFAGAERPQAESCDWDIGVSPEFGVLVNGNCGAGTFPLDAAQDFTTQTRADDAPEYADFLAVIAGAFPASVTDAGGIFWYGIQNNNRLWPTYNVFLVRVDQDVYKVQVHDYYSATGASGFPSVRFQRLR
ncbi:MAG: HmuY family protein [Gammaproteobacteria bacterium]|nr:HmuY family protein [Gammaproteobacteria bacterium]MDE0650904.1 HmuY family protein [Gammaproteobacteria bacterium]MXW10196.1 hypothetical protein [Gammaproteobacteria bacterium]MYC53284.1 hypothetical protein [Gammaproteobacteria bacterium]